MTAPVSSLKKFHAAFCPDVPIDAPETFHKLLREIEKLKK